eukprot:SAG31_NODE_22880_length_516_cov_0.805755_2_plen_56_part_01
MACYVGGGLDKHWPFKLRDHIYHEVAIKLGLRSLDIGRDNLERIGACAIEARGCSV